MSTFLSVSVWWNPMSLSWQCHFPWDPCLCLLRLNVPSSCMQFNVLPGDLLSSILTPWSNQVGLLFRFYCSNSFRIISLHSLAPLRYSALPFYLPSVRTNQVPYWCIHQCLCAKCPPYSLLFLLRNCSSFKVRSMSQTSPKPGHSSYYILCKRIVHLQLSFLPGKETLCLAPGPLLQSSLQLFMLFSYGH